MYAWDVKVGVSFAQFAAFVNDEDSSGYCTAAELQALALAESSLELRHVAITGTDHKKTQPATDKPLDSESEKSIFAELKRMNLEEDRCSPVQRLRHQCLNES